MTEDEIFEALQKETNKDDAERMYELWKEDPTRNLETLKKLAGVGFGNKIEAYTGKGRRPITEAFGINEDQYRLLIDPNSPVNWMTIPSKELLTAAIKGGYVQDIPHNATEEAKAAQRKEYNDFLRMLSDETNLQVRRNAVREYEKTKFTEDPIGWAQVGLNNTLFRTYQKRAKEQAMKGEGFSGSSNPMDLDILGLRGGDAAALTGDIGVNTMLGAGTGGIGQSLFYRGLGNHAGLRTFGNVAGSDIAAGVLGGLGSVANRDANTDEGAHWYEYGTEPVITGATNAIATPAVLREAAGNAARLVGLGGAKVGGYGKRGVLGAAQRYADEKYAEPALASALKDLESNAGRTIENSPVSVETAAKIDKMFDILNDGVSNSPGKATSLFDDLQTLYENSAKKPTGIKGEFNTGVESMKPTDDRFRIALDNKISDIEGNIANSAGKEEAPALQRELAYYRNFRELMDNGLVDVEGYLSNKNAMRMEAPKSNFVFDDNINTPFFELGKRASQSDINFMKDYIRNVNGGNNLVYNNGLATRVMELANKYPEFRRYIESKTMVPTGGRLSEWPSLGSSADPFRHVLQSDLEGKRAFGTHGADLFVSDALRMPILSAKDLLKEALAAPSVTLRDIGGDLVKPAIVEARLRKYDKPDNSKETLELKYNELRKRKPNAVDNAMSWKFDSSLPSDKQLTSEERDLIDRYREAQRRALLGDD